MQPEFFGLIMDPFESGPDPRFLYMDPARRNGFAQLLSSVYECKGMVLLACDRGLGKSTLIRHLADQLSALDSVLVLYPGGVLNCRPGMSIAEVLAACRGRFDRRQPGASDEDRLTATLERAAGRGQVAVLLLDDADALDDAALSRLRLLTEPDGEDRRLLSVILVGSQKLQRRLEQLAVADGGARGNRQPGVDLAIDLPALRDRDVDRLIRHRLTIAGHAEGDLFSPVALAEVARRSRGNPLHVIALCEAAMGLAERETKSTVSRDLIERAADHLDDLDLDDSHGAGEWGRSSAPAAGVAALPVEEATKAASLSPAGVHHGDVARRLDDVAEAIRAADLRSGGSRAPDPHSARSVEPRATVDPHIKFGPGLAPGREGFADEPEPEPAGRPVAAEVRSIEHPQFAGNDQRFYPGVRPSETHRPRGRGWLATVAMFGLILAVLAGAGFYALRSGVVDIGDLAGRVEVLSTKLVRLVSDAINADPAVGEGRGGDAAGAGAGARSRELAGVDAPPAGAVEDPHSTSLGFDRFGANRTAGAGADDSGAPAVEGYQFSPPPPQTPAGEPSRSRGGDAKAEPGDGASTAADNAGGGQASAQPPVSPPVPLPAPPPAKPASQAAPAGEGAQRAAADAEAAKAPPTAGSEASAGDVLDPGTAVILSRRGPPQAPKPTPPAPPYAPEQPASGGRAPAAAAPAQTASREPATGPAAEAPRNGRSDKNQAQFEPLLARGDEYLVTADLDMARTFYQMAYERGSAEAAVRMGWTFDPQYYKRAGVSGEASPREAILWYQEALRRGDRQASQRLSALATWLQSAAASGDVEAKRILKLWQG